jgi:hypothetical protein
MITLKKLLRQPKRLALKANFGNIMMPYLLSKQTGLR